jgi:hypothetical protein
VHDEPLFKKICGVIFKNELVLKEYFGVACEEQKSGPKDSLYFKKTESMLPLQKDWLFRPLFYIWSPEDKLQKLAQALFEFLKSCEFGPKREEISMVCSHLLMDKEEKIIFNHESKKKLAELIEVKIGNFDFKPDIWLLKNYKSIFDQGLFY